MRQSFSELTKKQVVSNPGALLGVSVLLVEDEMKLSRMYVKFLMNMGAVVKVAFDGVQGLDMLENEKPDIILLDLMMPRMNGYDMLKAAREKHAVGDVPVIILTNLKDRPEDVEKIQALGVSDYLIKSDTNLQELLSKIHMHVARREGE